MDDLTRANFLFLLERVAKALEESLVEMRRANDINEKSIQIISLEDAATRL